MLAQFFQESAPIFVLTGAGISTASGIPDYRDEKGQWKHAQPINYQDFVTKEHMRKRYWMRSMNGWLYVDKAKPNDSHFALSELEQMGLLSCIVTQNVDALHQQAGSVNVVNLHGTLDTVICLHCNKPYARRHIQTYLERENPSFRVVPTQLTPDGDANIERDDVSRFAVPCCDACQGILKPDVVFFGESVPVARKDEAVQNLIKSAGMLVVGSSLVLYSGYRFCKIAHAHNIPIVAVNRGKTRADGEYLFKIEAECGATLKTALTKLTGI